jgi:polyhydroxyalkanoate synthesis regulator phasin
MVDFNRSAFNNAFNAMVMVQDQTETLSNTMLNQATWLPEEGKKALQEWVEAFKKGREEYKKTVEDAFKKVESFF